MRIKYTFQVLPGPRQVIVEVEDFPAPDHRETWTIAVFRASNMGSINSIALMEQERIENEGTAQ